VRQVGQAHQQALQFGLDRFEPLGAGLQRVTDAGHFCQQRAGVGATGLELADLLAQAVATGLQFFGGGLHALALGFQRAVALDVQKRLRLLAHFQPRQHGGQVAAQ
jgi:hypothetical protein